MKIKEIISEVSFNKSYPYRSNNSLISKIKSRLKLINSFDQIYTFKDDLNNEYKVKFYHYESDVISVDFSLGHKMYLTKTTYDYREKTGIGIEFRILSTVINIIKEYISKNNPTVLLFSADEFHYDSYRGIVKRLIKNTNYVDVSNSYVRQIKNNEVRMVINNIFKNSSNVYSLFILCRKDLVNVENVSEAEKSERANRMGTYLRNRGYTQIGSGIDKTIWYKEGKVVIGIIMPEKSLESGMKAFVKIYQLSQMYPDNPHFPRFVKFRDEEGNENHYKMFTYEDKNYVQFGMEKLDKLRDDNMIKLINEMKPMAYGDIKYNLGWDRVSQVFLKSSYFKAPYIVGNESEYLEKIKSIYDTIKIILRNEEGVMVDIFSGDNVLQRDDGTVVFVDPYFSMGY